MHHHIGAELSRIAEISGSNQRYLQCIFNSTNGKSSSVYLFTTAVYKVYSSNLASLSVYARQPIIFIYEYSTVKVPNKMESWIRRRLTAQNVLRLQVVFLHFPLLQWSVKSLM
ncbi:hypothetical protein X801_01394, partial [Opisthorchis viverrini]